MWQQWTNLVLGIIIVAVPFLDLTDTAFTWTLIVIGLIIATLALWGAQETSTEREQSRMTQRRTQL